MVRSHYSTTDTWPPNEFDPILAELGRLIFNWNTIERTLTQILNILTGSFPKNQILTAHMSTTAICDALKTVANELHIGEERNHLLHAVSLFEVLRDYRNYYVHGFNTILFVPGDVPRACFNTKSAKSKLTIRRLELTAKQIAEVSFQCMDASGYLALVHNYFYYTDKPEYANLPKLHPLPPRFVKPKEPLLST